MMQLSALLFPLALLVIILSALDYASAFALSPSTSSLNRYDELIEWFTASSEKSYISPKVEILPSTRGGLATGGYGAFACNDLSKGETIFCIPKGNCVTLNDALNDNECGPQFQQLLKQAGPGADTVILSGYLAKEYLLLKEYDRRIQEGEKPDDNAEMRRLSKIKFAPYLRTLPWERGVNAQEHVLFWADEDVDALLKGSLAYSDAIETRESTMLATKILDGIISPIIRNARGEKETEKEEEEEGFRFPWQSKEEEKPSADENEVLEGLEEAVRGAMVISLTRAYAVSGDDGKEEDRLKPFLDMLQHSDAPNISHKCAEDGTIEVVAASDIKSGDELFNQYRGEADPNMPYHKFFTRFGFVPGVTEPVANLIAERSTIFFPQRAAV